MRSAVLGLLCLTALAAPDEKLVFGKKPYQVRPLDFTVALPDGWQAQQDTTGMVAQVARDPKGMGFLVSREPLLHDPKRFADAWQATLAAAGTETKVEKSRAGKYAGWSAAWETEGDGARVIEVHRIHVPDNEMLYNFSFSAPKDTDLKPLVSGVLRSFRFTGEKPDLEFNRTAEPIGTRSSITLPKGYEKPAAGRPGMRGRGNTWVKLIPGYATPHEAGRISLSQIGRMVSPKDGVDMVWAQAKNQFGEPLKRPRKRTATFKKMKGHQLTVTVLDKEGIPKVFHTFVFRPRQSFPIAITLVVDEREVRLHKDIFKQFCNRANFGD